MQCFCKFVTLECHNFENCAFLFAKIDRPDIDPKALKQDYSQIL